MRRAMGAGAAVAVLSGVLSAPGAAGAVSVHNIPVVSVQVGNGVSLSRTHLHPGRVTFDIHSSKGAHTLQLARLHGGYTLADANKDIGAGFGGDAKAISRVDANVTFLGGAYGSPAKTGHLTVALPAGRYLAVNFDNGAAKTLVVSGAPVHRRSVSTDTTVTMLTYGFDMASSIPRSGVMQLGNVSDQPHFIVVQHIRSSTSRAAVAAAFTMMTDSEPAFVLPGSFDTGVLSPYRSQQFSYRLPAGRYVIACFWPDDKTGMEHAEMGMFKVITLS